MKLFCYIRAVAISLAAPCLISCIPLFITSMPVHTVHLKIVVNSNFASHSLWRENVGNLIANANREFKSWIDVEFTVDTMLVWDMEQSECFTTMYRWDCLVSQIPKGSSDLVLYLEKESYYRDIFAGMAMYDEGYLLVEQLSGSLSEAGYKKSFHVLLHELGHIFGAVHTYFNKNHPRVMDPGIHDGLVKKVGTSYEYVEQDFHEGNAIIMSALRKRPFALGAWNSEDWEPIRTAYAKARAEFSPWRHGTSGDIENEEFDELKEDEMYLFLAHWASLCHQDSIALGYIDSLDMFVKAIRSTCIRGGSAGNARICSRCGTSEKSISQWFEAWENGLLSQRADIYLRWGKFESADSCFALFIKGLPEEVKETDRTKMKNGYALSRSRYQEFTVKKKSFPEIDTLSDESVIIIDSIATPMPPLDSITAPAIPDSLLQEN